MNCGSKYEVTKNELCDFIICEATKIFGSTESRHELRRLENWNSPQKTWLPRNKCGRLLCGKTIKNRSNKKKIIRMMKVFAGPAFSIKPLYEQNPRLMVSMSSFLTASLSLSNRSMATLSSSFSSARVCTFISFSTLSFFFFFLDSRHASLFLLRFFCDEGPVGSGISSKEEDWRACWRKQVEGELPESRGELSRNES